MSRQHEEPDAKQAVIMQNLGAVYNSLGKHSEAIRESDEAAQIYGNALLRSKFSLRDDLLYNCST